MSDAFCVSVHGLVLTFELLTLRGAFAFSVRHGQRCVGSLGSFEFNLAAAARILLTFISCAAGRSVVASEGACRDTSVNVEAQLGKGQLFGGDADLPTELAEVLHFTARQ